ncbi:Hypothetical predicted protein, partial [Paramuricea clavata]
QVINICPTREITASSGQITSPNYPSNYTSNTSCTLTIKQPLDTNFTFTFTDLDIESDEDELTCYDYLIISGGSSQTFCGTITPAPFLPGLNVVTLEMVTDGNVEQSGFDLSFTTVQTTGLPPAVSVCPTRSIIPSAIGRVHSPGFAGNYGANLNCKLTLNVPSNKEVEISFNHADIECIIVKTYEKLIVLYGKSTVLMDEASSVTITCVVLLSQKRQREGGYLVPNENDIIFAPLDISMEYGAVVRRQAKSFCRNGFCKRTSRHISISEEEFKMNKLIPEKTQESTRDVGLNYESKRVGGTIPDERYDRGRYLGPIYQIATFSNSFLSQLLISHSFRITNKTTILVLSGDLYEQFSKRCKYLSRIACPLRT